LREGLLVRRQDYAYPFRIDAAAHRAAQAPYADHVLQMIRQVLLTEPGERINLPEFGCGLRRLVFAPHSDALQATTKLMVMQALSRWLAGQIEVKDVAVSRPGQSLAVGSDAAGSAPDGVMQVVIEYVLIETRERHTAMLEVR
jgi:phage baseplate assembly protein W